MSNHVLKNRPKNGAVSYYRIFFTILIFLSYVKTLSSKRFCVICSVKYLLNFYLVYSNLQPLVSLLRYTRFDFLHIIIFIIVCNETWSYSVMRLSVV
jgi:hypothetical protein